MYRSGCSSQKTHLLQYSVSGNALYVAYLLTACGKNIWILSMEFTITAWRDRKLKGVCGAWSNCRASEILLNLLYLVLVLYLYLLILIIHHFHKTLFKLVLLSLPFRCSLNKMLEVSYRAITFCTRG